jgi:hypothetical protein
MFQREVPPELARVCIFVGEGTGTLGLEGARAVGAGGGTREGL